MARERARDVAAEQQDWQVDEETVERRREAGHRALAERLDTGPLATAAAERDPDAVLDALDDEAVRAYAADLDADSPSASDGGS